MANTTILFDATDSSGDQGLWVTNGTAAGTSELVQGATDNGGLYPSYLVSYDNLVLFDGEDASGSSGLWVTNGTAAGTSELAVTGAGTYIGLAPVALTVFGNSVYFSGADASNTIGLWVTNGTATGTSELAVANVGLSGLNPTDITVVSTTHGAALAFGGADSNGNTALWLSDGTAAGTSEIYVGSSEVGGVSPSEITPLTATTFVFAGLDANYDEGLFVSDGTTAGTSELTGIAGAPTDSDLVYYGGNMAVLGGNALFAGYYGTTDVVELWTTNGTAAGTSELAVANADTLEGLLPQELTQLGSLVLFAGLDAGGNDGLWVTNGTAGGTSELVGIAGAAADFQPQDLTKVGNEVYFNAIDTAGNDGLWVTDGTAAGTSEITPSSGANSGFYPNSFAQLVSCFVTGTRIRTLRGDVAVEDLRVGEMAVMHDGRSAPITWIGVREVACDAQPVPANLRPVRIAAGAFGCGLPTRDLSLSPDHAVFADGALIPVRYLVNGSSVVQECATRVTYWHVELPQHDVLLAEGLAVESYLETGQRAAFANGGMAMSLHPDFAARVREAEAYAPLVVTGPLVLALRQRLLPFAPAVRAA